MDNQDDILEYELIDIVIESGYEMIDDTTSLVCETGVSSSETPSIVYDNDGIPMGITIDEIKIRRQIIFQFYEKWKTEHPEKSVFNINLNADILIRTESVIEAAEHASKRYKSTLAVLRLDELLAKAEKIGEDAPKKGNKNQEKLTKMLLMSYDCHGLGIIKLTVGVRRRSLNKVQYGISVLEREESITPVANHKKKASHQK